MSNTVTDILGQPTIQFVHNFDWTSSLILATILLVAMTTSLFIYSLIK